MSILAEASLLMTASTEPAKLEGRPVALATSRPMVSAITLSEAFIIWVSRVTSGADWTDASACLRRGRGEGDLAGSTPSANARARPASSAGVGERRDSMVVGWIRPASSITAWIRGDVAAGDVVGVPARAMSGPENSETSTCTAVGLIPLLRT